jgi:hypothetical protein
VIANPEKYDGKTISVVGFLRLEFEGNEIYLHQEDYTHAIYKNGLWVELTQELKNKAEELNMHYVLLSGTFDSGHKGNRSLASGSITNITQAKAWPLVKFKDKRSSRRNWTRFL